MLYYSWITEKKSHEDVYTRFIANGADAENIFLDDGKQPKSSCSIYSYLKDKLIESHQSLCVDSLYSVGKNKREIAKELEWFAENGIRLIVLDLPITRKEYAKPIDILSMIFRLLADEEIEHLKIEQKKAYRNARDEGRHFGRSRIPYPDSWEKNYRRWKNGEISAVEFMSISGLKKGTFYNLVREYEADADNKRNQLFKA